MGTISKRTFEEALNIEFKKFGIYGFMDVVYKDEVLNKSTIKLFGGYFKDFLVSQNCIDNRHGLSFIYCFKIECLQRIYFLWYIPLLFIDMFYELYKIKTTKKKKTKRRKRWLFEEVINN
jgi:4-hydroxybenzoate polyprenyltransferase